MIDTALLQPLNPPQKEAVSAPLTHLLVLAGAGSGKTRVLTHRIAWLIEQAGVAPEQIFAVTFTNKAAAEMRHRLSVLLQRSLHHLWIGTFHGLSHRLLRMHAATANLPESFQILDAEDQYRLIRRVQKSLNISEEKWPPKQMQWFINHEKEQGRRAHQVVESNAFTETATEIYKAYESTCQRSGVVDFAELLLRSLELLENNPDIRDHYQQRFQHILVDEFQDTNAIQYAWLKKLSNGSNYFMAVGDDDQSIYSWRGAKIENIHRFSREFTPMKTIRLEQNYRSTQTILQAANALIARNSNRLGKELWTDGCVGDPITIYTAFNESDEAHYIVSRILDWMQQGRKPTEIAVLYRSNAQSRILEERLIDRRIPYRIYGGQKFFERAEIKDALAYFRLLVNRHDDAAFERVINTPTRGIGETTLAQLRAFAKVRGISLWVATVELSGNSLLENNPDSISGRAVSAIKNFIALIDRLTEETRNLPLGEQAEYILTQTRLIDFYKKDSSEKGLSRLDNLEELINATRQFSTENDLDLSPMAAFLSHVALEAGEEQAHSQSEFVSLMTLHAAKGLEFPLVIIAGLEEYLFPHRMSLEAAQGLEEERRLCYVGMTRAMEKLILTYAESRSLHGVERFCQPSRFIEEIPKELLDMVRPDYKPSLRRGGESRGIKTGFNTDKYKSKSPTMPKASPIGDTGLAIGQRVHHKKFGSGTIVNYEGHSEHARLYIQFDQHGAKWLVASYAQLTPVP